jgi:VanZ family protein
VSSKNKLILKYLALITWLVVIFLFSNQVATDSSQLSGEVVNTIKPWFQSIPESILTFLTRKAAHIGLYFVLGLVTYSIALEYKLRVRDRVLYSWIFVTVYAMTDEFHQMFVPGRSGEVRDVLIDSIAGLVGIGLYWFVTSREKTNSSS